MNTRQTFTKNLNHLIKQRKISRPQLAKILNVPYSNVVNWTTNQAYPSVTNLDKLTNYFHIPKSRLMDPQGNKTFTHNLNYFMKKREVKRPQLASALDVPYSTVVNWTMAHRYPNMINLNKIANYFHISKAKLIEPRMTYGFKLRELRKHKHMGTDLLSARSGVSNAQISRIERNEYRPKLPTLVKLAIGLGISKNYIFQIVGVTPRHIDLCNLLQYHKLSWQGHPLDNNDKLMIRMWFNNKYRKKS